MSSSEEETPSRVSRSTLWRAKKRRREEEPSSSSSSSDELQDGQQVEENVERNEGEPMYDGHLGGVLMLGESAVDEIPENHESDSDWSDVLDGINMIEHEQQPAEADEDDSDDADDPPDYMVENNATPEQSDSDSDPEEEGHFNFTHRSLDRVLELNKVRSVKESLLMTLALSIRHKLDYECLLNTFKSQNVLFDHKFFPQCKKDLWKILGRNGSGIELHVYCNACSYYIGPKRRLGQLIQCPICRVTVSKDAAKVFMLLCLKSQLQHFLSIPGVADLLNYRERRRKHDEDAIEDMFDGEHYKSIRVDGQELLGSNNFTWTLNSDGCRMRKGAKTLIQPVYARLNELPPKLRQKYMFLVAVYVGEKEPNMQSFLKPIVPRLNILATEGILWKPDGLDEIRSKFVPLCYCVDGKAKWQMLNMTPHSGYDACTSCTYHGVYIGNYMRYPWQHPDLPLFEMRTDQGMRQDMRHVERPDNVPRVPVRGHKGVTPMVGLRGLDLVKGNCLDDLHYFYECAALHHTKLLLREAPRIPADLGYDALCANIDARVVKTTTPGIISRKPGDCNMKNINQMHGSELRNSLLFTSVPCSQGLVPNNYIQHLELLSHSAYLLSMDSIKIEDTVKADRYLDLYLQQYDHFYGVDRSRLNLHSLKHGPNSVRLLGPLWSYSTFNFESWNYKLLQLVSSAKGVLSQIATRHLLHVALNIVLETDTEVSDDVKNHIRKVLMKRRREDGLKVGPHSYLRGAHHEREPTMQELQILQLEGLRCVGNFMVYDKMSVRSVDYKTKRIHNDTSKSDDTSVFTYQNTFCNIDDIVRFKNENEEEVCGLFVKELTVLHPSPFRYATHIKKILPGEIPHFIKIDQVRLPVVKVYVNDDTYFIPVPNTTEID